jgi:hypothetical protein
MAYVNAGWGALPIVLTVLLAVATARHHVWVLSVILNIGGALFRICDFHLDSKNHPQALIGDISGCNLVSHRPGDLGRLHLSGQACGVLMTRHMPSRVEM